MRLDIDLDRELWRGVEARAEEGWAWRVTAPVATTGLLRCRPGPVCTQPIPHDGQPPAHLGSRRDLSGKPAAVGSRAGGGGFGPRRAARNRCGGPPEGLLAAGLSPRKSETATPSRPRGVFAHTQRLAAVARIEQAARSARHSSQGQNTRRASSAAATNAALSTSGRVLFRSFAQQCRQAFRFIALVTA